MAETAQPPELCALEKRVLLLVSIVAAGGAERRRADRDHKPTGISTKRSKVDLSESAFSSDDSRAWQVRVALGRWLPEAGAGCHLR